MDIRYKGSIVVFRKYKAYWSMNPKKCPCCNELVKSGEAILVINNYEHFGNVLLHTGCFDCYEDKELLCETLEEKYSQYKVLDDVFGSRTNYITKQ